MNDAKAGGGLWAALFSSRFTSYTPAGTGRSVAVFVGLVVAQQLLLGVFAILFVRMGAVDQSQAHDLTRAVLMGLLPVGVIIAVLAVEFSRLGGGIPREVLGLRPTGLGLWRTALVVIAFIVGIYCFTNILFSVLNIDVAQYTPGPRGESPVTGSAGEVKEAMFGLANNAKAYFLTLPGVAIGAPLAEELIFRGQIFTALSRTRLGFSGTTVLTSAMWALMHISEPWLSIGIIFFMGLVLGYLLYRFGSLWLCILCHGMWNLLYSLVVFEALSG